MSMSLLPTSQSLRYELIIRGFIFGNSIDGSTLLLGCLYDFLPFVGSILLFELVEDLNSEICILF